jgi:adenine deaminase
MFCSDDKHPDSLVAGHINELCRRASAMGIDTFKILKAACLNPVLHYKMKVGKLRPGDVADLILCKDLTEFQVLATYVNGVKVAENGKPLLAPPKAAVVNKFSCNKKKPADFAITSINGTAKVIHALDGQLITESSTENLLLADGFLKSDTERDILKITVVNRYVADTQPSVAFIKNFGLKKGALASSVAHDSHNIIAVGVDDESISDAVNLVIERQGGISYADRFKPSVNHILALPVAGLLSNEDGYQIAREYTILDREIKKAGCTLTSPFMTLSFMALLVIPKLKLSDMGLFDGERFCFVNS